MFPYLERRTRPPRAWACSPQSGPELAPRRNPRPANVLSALRTAGPVTLLALLAFGALALSCSSDDGQEREPAQTATQTPTAATQAATPSPVSTPAPTAAATPAQTQAATPTPAAASMRDLVIDTSTTGKDLLDRLSEEEIACIKAAYGDAVFQFIRQGPVLAGGGDPAMAGPMFRCMTSESTAYLTAAFLAALTGAESEGSRQCFAGLALEHPGAIYASVGIGVEGEEPDSTSRHEFRVLYFDCMNDAEVVRYFSRYWEVVHSLNTLTGRDVLDVFTDSEIACFRDYFGDRYDEAFLAAPMNAGELGTHDMHEACFARDTSGRLFVTVMSALLGGVTGETAACLADFGDEHEHYVDDMIFSTSERRGALPDEEVAELARDGAIWVECLTEDEYRKLGDLLLGDGAIGRAPTTPVPGSGAPS